ncbi:MAG TPA: DUF4386 family protein [Anaerolineales bacterium]|nr:DUF4386 family protein [Anaerolineales bacterium]
MRVNQSFQRFTAVTAIVSFFSALASDVLQGIPVHFSPDVMSDPTVILSVGATGANLLRWGLILDMLGYYLPLIPVVLFIGHWFRSRNPDWIRFYTFCGLGYILIGATGAVVLAAIQLPLVNAYAQASGEQHYVLETVTRIIWNMVYGGMWNILGELLVGIWFFGAGSLLRTERRALGIVSMIVGISAVLDSLGMMLGLEALALLGLSIFLVLAPVWALWLGIDLLRKPVQIA